MHKIKSETSKESRFFRRWRDLGKYDKAFVISLVSILALTQIATIIYDLIH